MTGTSTQVCPKTESTVFKVWVIVCSVDSLCRLVPFRFFFLFASLDGNSRHKILECVSAASVGVKSFFAHQCVHSGQASVFSTCCLHGHVRWSLSKRCVGVSSRLFLGMQHRVRWVRRHVGLRHVDRMNEKG